MTRTIFPDGAVNKPLNLANINCIRINSIKSTFMNSIDRIQLSVDSRCYCFCNDNFGDEYNKTWTKMVGDKLIIEYIVHGSKVHVVKYPKDDTYSDMWFSISIQDPTRLALYSIKHIINKALENNKLMRNSVSLTQIEFASDFLTQNITEQNKLRELLEKSIVLKHSRTGSYAKYKTTSYQGKEGNVRKGTKGLRCYPKVINGNAFYRIELQANHEFIRYKKITLNNILDFAETYNPFDYLNLYKNIDVNKINDIINRVLLKKRPNLLSTGSKLAKRVFICAVRNYVLDGILNENNILMHESNLPVAKQMDHIKYIHSQYGLTYHKDRLFTRLEVQHCVLR